MECLALTTFLLARSRTLATCMRIRTLNFCDTTSPPSLFEDVDAIYNLASPASPIHYQRDPVQTIKTNLLGAVNMLCLAKRLKIPISQASTSEVYGDPLVHPQVEEYWGNVNPIGTRVCYEGGKRAAETLFFDCNRQHGVNIRWLEFSTLMVGERKPEMVEM